MKKFYPQKVANDITVVLRSAGVSEFPVNVAEVAKEISRAKYPDDPISVVKGNALPGFEGALVPAPPGKTGWGIFYNNAISSKGRINFTLGHELGHFLMHRNEYLGGFKCSTEDMATWESEYAQRENEANVFAATLLMPLDDFRNHIDGRCRPEIDQLGSCAERYEVSLIAATLRWLQYTSRPSMLVVSRDGYILWARSSKPAMKAGLFYRTRNTPPIEIPEKSLAANPQSIIKVSDGRELDQDGWLGQPCKEYALFSDQYDFTLSLLHYSESAFIPFGDRLTNQI